MEVSEENNIFILIGPHLKDNYALKAITLCGPSGVDNVAGIASFV